jgi:hypothetical protein
MSNPVQIVELIQPRCSLRFGVGACTATGTPKCYNTYGTCKDQANFDNAGQIRWRFIANRPGIWAFGDFSDPDDLATNCLPVTNLSISTSKSQLNVAGVLEGKSPFGIRSTCTVSMDDFAFDDYVGDFYLGDRSDLPSRNFWAVWTARNRFFGGMEVVIYDGYEGDALIDMRARRYVLDSVDGPTGRSGGVTLNCTDPLSDDDSMFPDAMDVRLTANITEVQTTIGIQTTEPLNLTKVYGIGGAKGFLIGTEIIFYTGYTDLGSGLYTLTGVTRGALNSTAATAQNQARLQRIGYFNDVPTYTCGLYLLTDHSRVKAAYIDTAEWDDEGGSYLATLRSTTVVTTPTKVFDLMGEITQQGMFYTWWDEYAQKVRMQAVRPPRSAVAQLDYVGHLIADSTALVRKPESVITRVFVYYAPRLWTSSAIENYAVVNGQIETENEVPESGGVSRALEVKARWVGTEAHAQQIISRILSRYRAVPRFLTIYVSAKDRSITVGDICDVTAREIVDTEGRFVSERWQVISWSEMKVGQVYALDMQTYELIGHFGFWMDNAAPNYLAASDAERETGAFWSDDFGLMSDGSPGYKWQ